MSLSLFRLGYVQSIDRFLCRSKIRIYYEYRKIQIENLDILCV